LQMTNAPQSKIAPEREKDNVVLWKTKRKIKNDP